MLSDDTETLRCKTTFAFFIPKKHENILIILEYNTPCLPPPLPPPIICISIQALSFISLQLDQTSNTITRDAYLANTSYHSLVSISEEAVMTCIPECKGKEEILCLQIVVIVIY